jgi:hypothetical protein
MSTLPGIYILMLPVNDRDVLSKLFPTGHMIELIVFMPESSIVLWNLQLFCGLVTKLLEKLLREN